MFIVKAVGRTDNYSVHISARQEFLVVLGDMAYPKLLLHFPKIFSFQSADARHFGIGQGLKNRDMAFRRPPSGSDNPDSSARHGDHLYLGLQDTRHARQELRNGDPDF